MPVNQELDMFILPPVIYMQWNKLSNPIVHAGMIVCFKGRLDSYMNQDEMW